MVSIKVLSYFDTEHIHPAVLIVRLEPQDWNSNPLYIPLDGPFEPVDPDNLGDLLNVTVLLEDLTVNPEHPDQVGILLNQLLERHSVLPEQMLVRLQDVEEVLQAMFGMP